MPDAAGRMGIEPGYDDAAPGRLWVPTGLLKTFDLSLLTGFSPLHDAASSSQWGWVEDVGSTPSYVHPRAAGTGTGAKGVWAPPIFDNDTDSPSGTRWRIATFEVDYYRGNSSSLIEFFLRKRAAQSGASGGAITTINTIDATELSVSSGTWTKYSTTFATSDYNLADGEGFQIAARMYADTLNTNARIGTCRVGVRAYVLE